ncbi:hypothetical protein [uncultured Sphingomonas sp.]|uniref:hypothetical protein n=1 Tax=uncultured Sphingomonas sp. TaxID=158754 RepID=UPI002594EC94|nr:hypothetical protein [uncultured Sphingomonas sp.]
MVPAINRHVTSTTSTAAPIAAISTAGVMRSQRRSVGGTKEGVGDAVISDGVQRTLLHGNHNLF